jgi:spermidine/putrescine transport system permease protein
MLHKQNNTSANSAMSSKPLPGRQEKESLIERFSKNPKFLKIFQLSPVLSWLALFLVTPLVVILVYSFCTRGMGGTIEAVFTVDNYWQFFSNSVYRKVLFKSLRIGAEVTVVTLFVGFIPAYYLATTKIKNRLFLIMLLIVPFWTSYLIRTYSWVLVLGREGVVNVYLLKLGIIDQPIQLLYTEMAVVMGLIHFVLPFMVFPIFSTLDKLDYNLINAAKNLGANSLQAFYRITLPLAMPGIAAGCLLVFILSVGSYITPALLGGPQDVMITQIITQRFLTLYDWPFGAAAAIIYLVVMLLFILIYNRVIGLRRIMNM